jgi:hypothetical protein
MAGFGKRLSTRAIGLLLSFKNRAGLSGYR